VCRPVSSYHVYQTATVAGVVAACHNAPDSVTISGDTQQVHAMVEELKAENVFAKIVNSAGVPFHSPIMEGLKPKVIVF
jgi:fatty acid synthase